MKYSIIALLILMTGCATFEGHKDATRILDCTVTLSSKTEAHIIDSSDVCIKAYNFERKPRGEK